MLFEIVESRKKQVEANKVSTSIQSLEQSMYFDKPCLSLKEYLCRDDKTGIIAEFKRASPSKGMFDINANVVAVTKAYTKGGASGLSIVTEPYYYFGKDRDLTEAKNVNNIPVLRKDFIIDKYQIIEAKSLGADAILLIAACLKKPQAKHLVHIAKALGLEVLFEIHTIEDLDKLPDNDVIISVNNRNLITSVLDMQTSFNLATMLSKDFMLVTGSGISTVSNLIALKKVGYTGFLIGEVFMNTNEPVIAFQKFVQELATFDK